MADKDIIITHWNASQDFVQIEISAPAIGEIMLFPQAIGYSTTKEIVKFSVVPAPISKVEIKEDLDIIDTSQLSVVVAALNDAITRINVLTGILESITLITR